MKFRANGNSNRDKLATDIIRENPLIWPGVGVYTVLELFWMAGVL
jgi:hypothetical protein